MKKIKMIAMNDNSKRPPYPECAPVFPIAIGTGYPDIPTKGRDTWLRCDNKTQHFQLL